jgi:hypothetical protein
MEMKKGDVAASITAMIAVFFPKRRLARSQRRTRFKLRKIAGAIQGTPTARAGR